MIQGLICVVAGMAIQRSFPFIGDLVFNRLAAAWAYVTNKAPQDPGAPK